MKRVLLIVGGGIAAYKTPYLVRELSRRGIATRVLLTKGGANFVTPLTLGAVSGDTVYGDLFDLTDEAEMGHIQLSRSAELIVVAPATANLMAKVAHGIADDLATTCILATDTSVVMCPAMNVRMWDSPATQANLSVLKSRGIAFIGPDSGDMACGEYGEGRMSEPIAIADAIAARLQSPQDLSGRRVVVTAGPTVEPIDPVRFVSNHSSGKQGYAVAESLARRGAEVVLVSGPTALPTPAGVTRLDVGSAREMLAAVESALPADVFVAVAAVADWGVANPATSKIKKSSSGAPEISWSENPDILATVAAHAHRPDLVVGFAAETDDVIAHARAKRARKGCDWILANDVSTSDDGGSVFGSEHNALTFLTDTVQESWPSGTKAEAADRLAARIADHFAATPGDAP